MDVFPFHTPLAPESTPLPRSIPHDTTAVRIKDLQHLSYKPKSTNITTRSMRRGKLHQICSIAPSTVLFLPEIITSLFLRLRHLLLILGLLTTSFDLKTVLSLLSTPSLSTTSFPFPLSLTLPSWTYLPPKAQAQVSRITPSC
jgi:hypothetical protein